MKYKIRTRQFCALSREPKFQDWLQNHAPDLHTKLITHLQSSTGCKANTEKMGEVQAELTKRNKLESMIDFLKKEYPITLEEIIEHKKIIETILLHKLENKIIFQYYNPTLLTFPQKIVFKNDNTLILEKDIKNFCLNKSASDYIIIGNLGYVEYFKQKYEKEAQSFPEDRWDIYKYRLKNKLSKDVKILENANARPRTA